MGGPDPPMYTIRVNLNFAGCHLFGWPSTGGILMKTQAVLVDLEWLGISRFKSLSRPSYSPSEEEDAWCIKLLQLGAVWYPSVQVWRQIYFFKEVKKSEAQELEAHFAWPTSGGVWALSWKDKERRSPINNRPQEWGKILMATIMEEKAMVIKEFDGMFFENPQECDLLKSAYDGSIGRQPLIPYMPGQSWNEEYQEWTIVPPDWEAREKERSEPEPINSGTSWSPIALFKRLKWA